MVVAAAVAMEEVRREAEDAEAARWRDLRHEM